MFVCRWARVDFLLPIADRVTKEQHIFPFAYQSNNEISGKSKHREMMCTANETLRPQLNIENHHKYYRRRFAAIAATESREREDWKRNKNQSQIATQPFPSFVIRFPSVRVAVTGGTWTPIQWMRNCIFCRCRYERMIKNGHCIELALSPERKRKRMRWARNSTRASAVAGPRLKLIFIHSDRRRSIDRLSAVVDNAAVRSNDGLHRYIWQCQFLSMKSFSPEPNRYACLFRKGNDASEANGCYGE